MRVKDSFEYPDQIVERGTILAVEDEHGDELLFILAGPLSNRSVHINYLEEIDVLALDEELKDLRAERNVLRNRVRFAEADALQATSAADRLQENVVQLTRELREAQEGKKVPLPREVAEAIKHYSSHGFINTHGIYSAILREENKKAKDARQFLIASCENPWDLLMEALVNGYTVEEPEQTSKQKAIRYLIDKNLIATGYSAHDVVTEIMSILGTEQSG